MALDNPRYLAYCRAHGVADPEQMLREDDERWPGGKMCGFMLWIAQRRTEFRKANPEAFLISPWDQYGSIFDFKAWDKFLEKAADSGVRLE